MYCLLDFPLETKLSVNLLKKREIAMNVGPTKEREKGKREREREREGGREGERERERERDANREGQRTLGERKLGRQTEKLPVTQAVVRVRGSRPD